MRKVGKVSKSVKLTFMAMAVSIVWFVFNGDARQVIKQIALFGYDPDNFNGKDALTTANGSLVSLTPYDFLLQGSEREIMDILKSADLIISGSVEPTERLVFSLKPSGKIVARYSIFFGGPSGYTGNPPEVTGYALDIPKDVRCVNALLSNDAILEGIVARDRSAVNRGLTKIAQQLDQIGLPPVIATPYLDEILS